MPNGERDVTIQLRAEAQKLRNDLNKGKEEISRFKKSSVDAFKKIGIAVAGAFAVSKIVSFVKTGITEFAKFDRTLKNITGKVERLGQGFEGLEESIEGYIRAAEAATRFSKFEVADSLDQLVLMTGDYSTALDLNEKAMDFAVLANISLQQASQALGLAFEGNTSGTSQLARVLGMSTEEAKDLEVVFKELEQASNGLARAEDTLATKLDKLRNSTNDAAEAFGERFGPELIDAANWWIPNLQKGLELLIQTFDTIAVAIVHFGLQLKNVMMLAVNVIRMGPQAAWKQFMQDMTTTSDVAFDELVRIWGRTQDDITKKGEEGAAKRDKTNKKERKSNKKTADDFKKFWVQVYGDKMKLEKQVHEWTIQMNTAFVMELGLQYQGFMTMTQEMAQGISEAVQVFVVSMLQGTTSVAQAFKELARGIFKAMVSAIGGALMSEGAGYIARSIAAALGIYTAWAAPGLAAAGAKLLAMGALIKGAAIAFLAEGGIVTEPTATVLGEKGPEAVIPLNEAGLAAAGGGPIEIREMTFSFPGVRKREDVDERFGRTVARRLAESQDELRQRGG